MTRTFIQTNEFVKKWEEMGLTDEDFYRHATIYLITAYSKSEKDNLSRQNVMRLRS